SRGLSRADDSRLKEFVHSVECLLLLKAALHLLRRLDDQLGDLLRKRQHRDMARWQLDLRSLGRLRLVGFHLWWNDRIVRRNDHERRLFAPRGLAYRSGEGPDVEWSLCRRHDCLFLGGKIGCEIFLDTLFAYREVTVRVLDERLQAFRIGIFRSGA